LQKILGALPEITAQRSLLEKAIVDDPPAVLRDGGVIAEGFDAQLDQLRELSGSANAFLVDYEKRQQDETGISGLKVGYNRVHGYFIEVGRSHQDKVPAHYTRRQTLKAAERYITEELKTFEVEVLTSKERALAREKQLYAEILETLQASLDALQDHADYLSRLDVLSTFAERACSLDLTRPSLSGDSGIDIRAGRHLVVEQLQEEAFTPNDMVLDDETRMLIITGPNMGGKSTYMRQVALIVILAYAGSWVPADRATIGPVDRIFTRVGAGDDLSRGRSTFMVEMSETANILHHATADSLVLMDEIGRGTSTYDGLSLAWASASHLATEIGAFTLFATHYFEMTQLAGQQPRVRNVHLHAVEHKDRIVFLHAVQDGPASQSYGLQVAALAGVPESVLTDARQRLDQLERLRRQETPQLGLFDSRPASTTGSAPAVASDAVRERLKGVDPDQFSPRQALDLVYELVSLAKDDDHQETG
ncbi:MAG: DNA mismatch repair protein MutS, partial [Xanthomonadales bacterium]|nr:DNA mismatch repair protein MutS [Xanthomonadales bacterium]